MSERNVRIGDMSEDILMTDSIDTWEWTRSGGNTLGTKADGSLLYVYKQTSGYIWRTDNCLTPSEEGGGGSAVNIQFQKVGL